MKIHVNTQKLVNLFWIVLIALHSIGLMARGGNYLVGHKYDRLVHLVDTSEEANIPTWFSVELFFISAVLLLVIAMTKKSAGDRWARHWKWLSVIFFYLSLDDLAQLHETMIIPLRTALHTSGVFYYAWIIVYIPLCLVVGLLYLKFVFSLPHNVRDRVIVAGTVFITSKLPVEMMKGYFHEAHIDHLPVFPLLTTVAELGKAVGLVLFISALWGYVKSQPDLSSISFQFVPSPGPDACEAEPQRTGDKANTIASV